MNALGLSPVPLSAQQVPTGPALTLAGTGSYLPDTRMDVAEAAKRYPDDHDRILATGYATVAAEETLYPADMALIAAERALATAGVKPSDLRLLMVTGIHRHGHKRLWSPASWLQSKLGCPRALPLTVNQGCNAQMLGLEVAARYLGGLGGGPALVVATDRFGGSSFDRFTADYGIVYGDGAAAAVLTTDPDATGWRIAACHTVSDPGLEGLHRADEPAPERPDLLAAEHDVRSAKRRFLSEHGMNRLREATRAAVGEISRTLLPAGVDPRLCRIVYPNLGLKLLEENYFPEFPGGADASLWAFGRTVGHLGSGDQIAGLDHIADEAFAPGDRLLLLGAGAGFSWTGMLVERV
ncbi:ketoacyl-ACP synthase III family protein [Streptomyces mirabilis]|uniref:ketoacyl-ACP synthase III family protein n=1 Tax=Streptomyces mirabilis TaxID=68239 RepID=UPI003316A49C